MLTRRDFLKASAILGAGAGFVPYFESNPVQAWADPNNRLRMACIGVGSMGRLDMRFFNDLVDIVAVCDVDQDYGLASVLKCGFGRKKGDEVIQPDTYTDYRKVLERPDIDCVMIATPDHWHTKIAVEALQAGKHVFCEKPLTLTLEENLIIRRAAEKYGKVFQVGTMQRCFRDQFQLATLIVRGGYLGKIEKVTVDIGESPSSPVIPKMQVPASLDWNMWLGQAPYTEFLGDAYKPAASWEYRTSPRPEHSRCHFTFRWWYEYSGGKFTDWGAHHIDIALWAMNRQKPGTGPVSIDGADAKHPVPYKDGWAQVDNQYNTATQFNVYHTFDDGCVMNVCSNSRDGNGILFEGTKGRIHVSRGRIKGKLIEEGIQEEFKPEDYLALSNGKEFSSNPLGYGGQDRAYWESKVNWIRCIREGGTPICDVASHVQCAHLCHLSGIAARFGRTIQWDSLNEKIVGDEQAAAFFSREQRKGFEIPKVD
ncbi:MAG: Gfo/Idh/MocA family oxidoreductase [Thermoguttaceae bacterium]|nr:Gfo/Idh/MocA family oxidoreductase [Thermoguttaceae bacterium]